ncbi:hypothetical protein HSBAA_21080 [Vreelandella sulfidaeris]|uniref:Uncharacterized protein n=1 Tax=Vreelandella sulfidaeris TaxID=115553 RepID=A0A455U412_9GAMM|nr:hypothetical protein HSBAA_21080 [Halomonas sulfidaeris]
MARFQRGHESGHYGALKVGYLPFIFVMLFTNFFDAMSCFMALAETADLKDEEGNPAISSDQ